MQIEFSGKTAIVTGSTKGIGLATASMLANAGAKVFLTGRTEQSVNEAVENLKSRFQEADITGVAADLGTAEGCKVLTDVVPSCDILINNVGIYGATDFFEISDEEWQQYYDVNVMTAVRLSRHYAPAMAEQKWGRILFVASESAINIPVEMIQYGTSKSAILGLSRGLAKRMAETGVTVNAVLPGPTLSEGAESILQDIASERDISVDEAGKQFVMENRPSSITRRFASTEEVANMIVYTCSEQASATTGSALRVDGGIVDFIM